MTTANRSCEMKNMAALIVTVGLWMAVSAEPVRAAEKQTGGKEGATIAVPYFTSDSNTWKRVPYEAVAPTGGVRLAEDGLFKRVMERNIQYWLTGWHPNLDDMLKAHRLLAGVANAPGTVHSWVGSHSSAFLMGVGSTLQWQEHPELRQRLNQLIEGLKACRTKGGDLETPDTGGACYGFNMTLFAHGLMAAGNAGNPDAWDLLAASSRAYRKHVETMVNKKPRWAIGNNATPFGLSACMVEALSPVGVPDDIQGALKHTHPGWLGQLAERDSNAIYRPSVFWQHSACTYIWVGVLDLYRATGDKRFLDAMIGAWEMMLEQWGHPGGSQAICEHDDYPPRSFYITPGAHTGELCSHVWWIRFSHKLHQLFPMQERYANEIEKCIYNVGLANQAENGNMRYHTHLEGRKDNPGGGLSCCEAVGTLLYGSLPEYIYSIADDGLFVNLFEPSSITWKQADQSLKLTMESRFPFKREVALRFKTDKSVAMKLRVRTPAWAAKEMPIMVNGKQMAVGKPGSYVMLDRIWADGDRVEFTLPTELRATLYEGVDQIPGHKRFSVKYGSILMAAIGPVDNVKVIHQHAKKGKVEVGTLLIRIAHSPNKPQEWLKAVADQPLSFLVDDQSDIKLTPYWQIDKMPKGVSWTCFPVIEPKEKE